MRITLFIHGPLNDNCVDLIDRSVAEISSHVSSIIISSWESDKHSIDKIFSSTFCLKSSTFYFSKDPINPGFANINRQIVLCKLGLSHINDDEIVIKLRIDQCVSLKKCLGIIECHYNDLVNNKIITTNCYTRKDRLYHPSDMFLIGQARTLKEYYSVDLMSTTDLECRMLVQQMLESNPELHYNPIAPESYLFRNYLDKKGWDKKETNVDSFNALLNFFIILNSWDIDLTWNKARNFPFKKKNAIIIPHAMSMPPFEHGMCEKIRCYYRSDFTGSDTFRDKFYKVVVAYTWYFFPDNQESCVFLINKSLRKYKIKKDHCRDKLKSFSQVSYLVNIWKLILYSFNCIVLRMFRGILKRL